MLEVSIANVCTCILSTITTDLLTLYCQLNTENAESDGINNGSAVGRERGNCCKHFRVS